MAAITDRYSFGLVSPSLEPTQVAKTLGGLSSGQIDTMKRAALQARLSINADVEMSKLVYLYKQLLGENSQPQTTSEPCES